jgi:hypothetical protein
VHEVPYKLESVSFCKRSDFLEIGIALPVVPALHQFSHVLSVFILRRWFVVNHVPQNLLNQRVVFGSNGVGVYEKEIVAGVVTVLLPTECEVMQVICRQ